MAANAILRRDKDDQVRPLRLLVGHHSLNQGRLIGVLIGLR